jgi:hypothetical protein
MRLAEYFDLSYVVNLPQRTDRRREMVGELAQAGLPADGSKLIWFPAIRPDDAADFPSIGARGCFLSHLSILKDAHQRGARTVLIMEDDLAISPQLKQCERELVEQLARQDWDFAYLGHVQAGLENTYPFALMPTKAPVMTTHFYLLHVRVLGKLIEFLEAVLSRPAGHPAGGAMHVDGAYSMFRAQNPGVRTLLASPSLGGQRSSRSDVADNSWYDSAPLRPLAHMARGVKSWLKRQTQSAGAKATCKS